MLKKYLVNENEKNLMLKGKWKIIYECDFFTIFKVVTHMELKLVYRTKKEPYQIIESICFDKNKLAIKDMVVQFNTALCIEGVNFKEVKLNL